MRFGASQKVCALDFVVVEVNNLLQAVEVRGSVSHNHDYVGPVHHRPVAGQRHHCGVLIHSFGGFPVRMGVMITVSLKTLRSTIVKNQGNVDSIVFPNETGNFPKVIRICLCSQRFHFRCCCLSTKGLVKVKAKLGKENVFEFHQPEEEVWRLYCFLRLPSKQMLLGLSLFLKNLAPCL